MEHMYLSGSEEVQRASHTMSSAADQFSRSVRHLDDVLYRHRMYMDEWIVRYERCVEALCLKNS